MSAKSIVLFANHLGDYRAVRRFIDAHTPLLAELYFGGILRRPLMTLDNEDVADLFEQPHATGHPGDIVLMFDVESVRLFEDSDEADFFRSAPWCYLDQFSETERTTDGSTRIRHVTYLDPGLPTQYAFRQQNPDFLVSTDILKADIRKEYGAKWPGLSGNALLDAAAREFHAPDWWHLKQAIDALNGRKAAARQRLERAVALIHQGAAAKAAPLLDAVVADFPMHHAARFYKVLAPLVPDVAAASPRPSADLHATLSKADVDACFHAGYKTDAVEARITIPLMHSINVMYYMGMEKPGAVKTHMEKTTREHLAEAVESLRPDGPAPRSDALANDAVGLACLLRHSLHPHAAEDLHLAIGHLRRAGNRALADWLSGSCRD